MIELAQEVREGCGKLLKPWNEVEDKTADAFQRRYLYANAQRAVGTAKSFWILHKERCFFDCHNLARTLYERSVNGYVALKSPERAASLMASELANEIESIKKMMPLGGGQNPSLKTEIERREKELPQLLSLAGETKAGRLNRFEMAREIEMQDLHRSVYWILSDYAHPNYGVSRPGQGDEDWSVMRFVALSGPLHAAAAFYRGFTKGDLPEFAHALLEKITHATVIQPD